MSEDEVQVSDLPGIEQYGSWPGLRVGPKSNHFISMDCDPAGYKSDMCDQQPAFC